MVSSEKAILIYNYLSANNIPIIVDGGWGVDALIGWQTREHQDLDLLIPIELYGRVKKVLRRVNFAVDKSETDPPYRMLTRELNGGASVDCHFVMDRGDKGAVFRIYSNKKELYYDYLYGSDGIEGEGLIDGQKVKCITAKEQLKCRTKRDYSMDDIERLRPKSVHADLHDIAKIKKILI